MENEYRVEDLGGCYGINENIHSPRYWLSPQVRKHAWRNPGQKQLN